MAEMTDSEALGILQRLDAEQRSADAQITARKHIGGVIKRFQAVIKEMAPLVAEEKSLQTAITRLKGDLESKRNKGEATINADHKTLKAGLEVQVHPLRRTVTDLKEKVKKVEENLAEGEERANERLAEFDRAISEKQEAFEKLKTGFDSFKKEHGLS